jgi:competence protein ComEC
MNRRNAEPQPVRNGHHRPLVWILIVACVGIVVDRVIPLPVWCWCLLTVAPLVCWLLLRKRLPTATSAILVLLAILSLAAAWHHLHWYLFDAHDIGRFAGSFPKTVALRVETVTPVKHLPPPASDPLWTMPTDERSRLKVRVVALRDGIRWRPAAGKAQLLVDGRLEEFAPGARLQVFGRILRPPPANNPGEFNFADYRRTQRQLCVLRASDPACVTPLEQHAAGGVQSWFAVLRALGSRLLWDYLAHERAGLAAAVLLGEREQLEHNRTEAFIKTGTIHLLAISGLHIGILVSILMLSLRFGAVPRGLNLAAIALLTIFYALLTDARPPVMRATVLIVALCIAMYLYRRSDGFNTLALAALVVLFWNPANLFRVGTQLSFLAVTTLICLEPAWRRWQQREREPLRALIASTRPLPYRMVRSCWTWGWHLTLAGLAIFLVALPLVMYHFHLFTPVGVLLTPLLYLPVALALASGLGVLLFGWLLPPLAQLSAWVCDLSLGVLEWTVTTASQMPGSYAWVPGPPAWWLALFYAALALWALLPNYRPQPRRCLALLAAWILVPLVLLPIFSPARELRCSFIAVGQGCAVLVELPDGKAMLYDAGRMGSPTAAVRAISSTLWSQGRTHLDAIIISHADADHFNAIPEILKRFSVGTIYVSPLMREDSSPAIQILYAAIEQANVPIRTLARHDRFESSGTTLTVLHPWPAGVEETHHGSLDNANSIVLSIEQAGRRILLTGDLESAGLDALLAEPPLDCDVILAPHHGSRHSRPHDFAAWSQPEWTVAISGLNELPPHVTEAYAGPGRTLIHTGRSGAVRVRLAGGQISVSCQRDEATAKITAKTGRLEPNRPREVAPP